MRGRCGRTLHTGGIDGGSRRGGLEGCVGVKTGDHKGRPYVGERWWLGLRLGEAAGGVGRGSRTASLRVAGERPSVEMVRCDDERCSWGLWVEGVGLG